MKGCTELAEEVFGLPSRIGVPLELGTGLSKEIESPEFATVAGLAKGAPGTGSSENLVSVKSAGSKKKKLSDIIKKVQEFFDEL